MDGKRKKTAFTRDAESIKKHIKLVHSKEQRFGKDSKGNSLLPELNIIPGSKRGQFKMNFTVNKVFSASDPNEMTLQIKDTTNGNGFVDFVGYKWKLIVAPGEVCEVSLSNNPKGTIQTRRMRRLLGAATTKELGTFTVDSPYTTYLTAKDEYGN